MLNYCLQSIDTVGCMSERTPGWISVWSKVQVIRIWYSLCYCHPIVSCFIKIENVVPLWNSLTRVEVVK